MTEMSPVVGPLAPLPTERMVYALDALESSMQVPETSLTPAERVTDEAYLRAHTQYTTSVLMASRPEDIFIVDEAFKDQIHLLDWLRRVYGRFGIEMSKDIRFSPPKKFAVAAHDAMRGEPDLRAVSTICFSYVLDETFPDPDRLAASRHVNAKTSLPVLAKKYSLSIPRTVSGTVAELSELYASEFAAGGETRDVFVKLDGLGGGANVIQVSDAAGIEAVQQNHPQDINCTMQQAVPKSYLQTIHIYTVDTDGIEYQGSRGKMVSGSEWYGNIFSPQLHLSDKQRSELDKAADAVFREGYVGDKPILLGFDAFMDKDDVLITEINARWLGSSPSEYIFRRLGIYTTAEAVAMSDSIDEHEISKYMDWIEQHLYTRGDADSPDAHTEVPFSVLPLGFSGYVVNGSRLAGCIVLGDFLSFQTEFKRDFSDKSFPLLDHTAENYQDTMRKISLMNGET